MDHINTIKAYTVIMSTDTHTHTKEEKKEIFFLNIKIIT